MRAKSFLLALACAGLAAAVPSRAAITSYSAELTTGDLWPGSGAPLRGNASLALDDSTNELSWAINWAGSDARYAQVTVRGDAPAGVAPLVLDLGANLSSVDLPGGGSLSGSLRLTPRQAQVLCEDDWLVELRLNDGGALRLTGRVEPAELPPGLWL